MLPVVVKAVSLVASYIGIVLMEEVPSAPPWAKKGFDEPLYFFRETDFLDLVSCLAALLISETVLSCSVKLSLKTSLQMTNV